MLCNNCDKHVSNENHTCTHTKGLARQRTVFFRSGKTTQSKGFVRRAVICAIVIVITVGGFYTSLIISADPLSPNEHAQVEDAIEHLEKSGFTREAFFLRNFAVFRGNDNWLNASIAKENAYAATNFPFGIITIYPDFFSYSSNDVERSAILLHEAKHLEGSDESKAYRFVWENKKNLGWTEDKYRGSVVWKEVRKQTKEYVPNLFVCEFNEYSDCTQ